MAAAVRISDPSVDSVRRRRCVIAPPFARRPVPTAGRRPAGARAGHGGSIGTRTIGAGHPGSSGRSPLDRTVRRPSPIRCGRDRPDPDPMLPRTDRLYFRQLLAGRDFAVDDQVARQMVNFVYLIGDRETGEAVIVDPAYGVDELLGMLRADGMECVGALATHYHPDHVGRRHDGVGHRGHHPAARGGPGAGPRPGGRGALGGPLDRRGRRTSWSPTTAGTWSRSATVPITLVHTPGHTPGQPVLPGRRPAGRRRHPVPRRVRPDRPARRGPRGAVRVARPPGWPGCPTTPCSTPVTSTRRSRRPPWGTPGRTTTCSGSAPPSSG